MKTRHIIPLAALLLLALIISGCDIFGTPLSATQRVQAFVSSINATTQDIGEIKDHFSPSSNTYSVIDASYWDTTQFDSAFRPGGGFVFGSLTEDTGNDGGYTGATTITTTFTSTVKSAVATTFVLVPDSNLVDNWLIRAVTVDGDTLSNVK